MTEEAERQPEVTAEPGPAAATAAGPRLVPAQRAPAEEREERQDHPDEDKASPEQEKASRKPERPVRKRSGRPEERAGRPGEGAAPWDEGTAPPPEAGTARDTAAPAQASAAEVSTSTGTGIPAATSPSAEAGPRPCHHHRQRDRHAGPPLGGISFAPDPACGHEQGQARSQRQVAVRDRAADWVATQVGRAGLISCDKAMCQALEARQRSRC